MKAIFVLIIFYLPVHILAAQHSTTEEFCAQLMNDKEKMQSISFDKWSLLYKMTFQKSKIARVVQLNPSQQQNVRHDINADVTVFSLGSDDPLNPNEQGHANFLQSDSSFIMKKITFLVNSSSYQDCLDRAQLNSFHPRMMNEYLKNLSDFSYIKQRQEGISSSHAINLAKKNIPHLKKVKSKNWSEILQYVLSNKVSNIVLILHASSSGRLFDADSNEIPHTFFLALNSVVQSVTVFSCHSDKVIESYGMNTGKFHFRIYLPQLISPWSQMDVTPIQFFHLFAKPLRNLLITNSTEFSKNEICKMTMNNSFEKALSLQLNGRPIGILQPRENQQEFNFPCSWLKDRGNNIFAQPASGQPFQTNTPLESVNLNWQIETPKSKIKLRSHKVFSTTKGELRSLIWID